MTPFPPADQDRPYLLRVGFVLVVTAIFFLALSTANAQPNTAVPSPRPMTAPGAVRGGSSAPAGATTPTHASSQNVRSTLEDTANPALADYLAEVKTQELRLKEHIAHLEKQRAVVAELGRRLDHFTARLASLADFRTLLDGIEQIVQEQLGQQAEPVAPPKDPNTTPPSEPDSETAKTTPSAGAGLPTSKAPSTYRLLVAVEALLSQIGSRVNTAETEASEIKQRLMNVKEELARDPSSLTSPPLPSPPYFPQQGYSLYGQVNPMPGGTSSQPSWSASIESIRQRLFLKDTIRAAFPALDVFVSQLKAPTDLQILPEAAAEFKKVREELTSSFRAGVDDLIRLTEITANYEDTSKRLEGLLSDSKAKLAEVIELRESVTKELHSRELNLNQIQVNLRLVYAVYVMIATIFLSLGGLFLYIILSKQPDVVEFLLRERVLIELTSMGFLLLAIIILGTAKILEAQGLAALLGTIAGYIFVRKATGT